MAIVFDEDFTGRSTNSLLDGTSPSVGGDWDGDTSFVFHSDGTSVYSNDGNGSLIYIDADHGSDASGVVVTYYMHIYIGANYNSLGIGVRADTSGNSYYYEINNSDYSLKVKKLTAGASTLLDSHNHSNISNGGDYILKVTDDSGVMTFAFKEASSFTVGDSGYTTTHTETTTTYQTNTGLSLVVGLPFSSTFDQFREVVVDAPAPAPPPVTLGVLQTSSTEGTLNCGLNTQNDANYSSFTDLTNVNYLIIHPLTNDFERGRGYINTGVLERKKVYQSSNANNKVDFGPGIKIIQEYSLKNPYVPAQLPLIQHSLSIGQGAQTFNDKQIAFCSGNDDTTVGNLQHIHNTLYAVVVNTDSEDLTLDGTNFFTVPTDTTMSLILNLTIRNSTDSAIFMKHLNITDTTITTRDLLPDVNVPSYTLTYTMVSGELKINVTGVASETSYCLADLSGSMVTHE